MDRQDKDEYTFWKKTFMLRLWLIRSMRDIYKNRGTRSDNLQFEGERKLIKQYIQYDLIFESFCIFFLGTCFIYMCAYECMYVSLSSASAILLFVSRLNDLLMHQYCWIMENVNRFPLYLENKTCFEIPSKKKRKRNWGNYFEKKIIF